MGLALYSWIMAAALPLPLLDVHCGNYILGVATFQGYIPRARRFNPPARAVRQQALSTARRPDFLAANRPKG